MSQWLNVGIFDASLSMKISSFAYLYCMKLECLSVCLSVWLSANKIICASIALQYEFVKLTWSVTVILKHRFLDGIHRILIILALCILWSGVLERSFGVEYRNGVESNFGVENTLVFFIIRYNRRCVKIKNEWLIGLAYQIYNWLFISPANLFWSGVEWSQLLEWQMLYSSKYSRTYENIQRVWPGQSPSVVLLSVHTRPGIFATQTFDSTPLHSNTPLQYSTPKLRSKTPLHRIHSASLFAWIKKKLQER